MIYRDKLHKKIIRFHNSGNQLELLNAYVQASKLTKNVNEKAFFLTQSYVFSLELGEDKLSESIYKKLKKMKRI